MTDTLHEKFFPFHRFGLRRNPFANLTSEEWFEITVLPPVIEDALATGFDHLVVMGEQGRGKSTTLNYLCRYFAYQGDVVAYERIPRWRWGYQTDTAPLDMFALDEAQRLAPWLAWRLFDAMQGKRLIIGTHRDLSHVFRRYGWPVLTVRLENVATHERLALILARRLAYFALNASESPQISFAPDAVDYLWAQYRDDLRTMTFFLYDFFGKIESPGAITGAQLAAFKKQGPPR